MQNIWFSLRKCRGTIANAHHKQQQQMTAPETCKNHNRALLNCAKWQMARKIARINAIQPPQAYFPLLRIIILSQSISKCEYTCVVIVYDHRRTFKHCVWAHTTTHTRAHLDQHFCGRNWKAIPVLGIESWNGNGNLTLFCSTDAFAAAWERRLRLDT